jgi:integrase
MVLGSRRGELCSLCWSDVDFEHGEVGPVGKQAKRNVISISSFRADHV